MVKMQGFFQAALLLFLVLWIECHEDGAPLSACVSLTPGHDVSAQNTKSPYVVKSALSRSRDGTVSVTIDSPFGKQFKGFIIQARDSSDKIVDGTFSTNAQSHFIKCSSGKNGNTLTHSDNSEKTHLSTVWTPPPGFKGSVAFKATIVQDFNTFWTGMSSDALNVNGGDHAPGTTTTLLPAITNAAPHQSELADCGKTVSCYTLPQGCKSFKDGCLIILKYALDSDGKKISFDLSGQLQDEWRYVSMGLNVVNKMHGASVTDCIFWDNAIHVKESWNKDSGYGNQYLADNEQQGITVDSVSFKDNILQCKWKRDVETVVKGHTYDLINQTYYVLLAIGELRTSADGAMPDKAKHKHRLASSEAYNLTEFQVISSDNKNLFIKLHGSLMVGFWLGIVSISILLARYYKNVWESSTLCGVKIWFAFHRALMLLGLCMAIAAFVLIFVEIGTWSDVYPNPHPILGCICMGLGLMQPVMALFRPSPNARRRPIFNWLHWFVGNTAQIIAVVTIFFAISLDKAALPDPAYYWVLISFIGFHFLFHVIMQMHALKMDGKMHTDVRLQSLGETNDNSGPKDAPGSGFRKFMLGIYIVVNIGLMCALILMIWLSKNTV